MLYYSLYAQYVFIFSVQSLTIRFYGNMLYFITFKRKINRGNRDDTDDPDGSNP